MATKLGEHTNPIQDGTNRRAIYGALRHEPPRTFTVTMNDATQAQSIYAIIPWNGTIEKVYAVGSAVNSSGGTPHQHKRFSFGRGAVGGGGWVHFGQTAGGIEVCTFVSGLAGHGSAGEMPALTPSAGCRVCKAGDIMSFSSNGINGGSQGAMDVTFTVVVQVD
jgi:hypothetical protein